MKPFRHRQTNGLSGSECRFTAQARREIGLLLARWGARAIMRQRALHLRRPSR